MELVSRLLFNHGALTVAVFMGPYQNLCHYREGWDTVNHEKGDSHFPWMKHTDVMPLNQNKIIWSGSKLSPATGESSCCLAAKRSAAFASSSPTMSVCCLRLKKTRSHCAHKCRAGWLSDLLIYLKWELVPTCPGRTLKKLSLMGWCRLCSDSLELVDHKPFIISN